MSDAIPQWTANDERMLEELTDADLLAQYDWNLFHHQ